MTDFYNPLLDKIYAASRNTIDSLGFSESDIGVCFSNQGVSTKNKTYCVISVIDMQQSGHSNKSSYVPRDIDSGVDETTTQYIVHLQYSIVGESSIVIAPQIRQQLSGTATGKYNFSKEGLGILNKTSLRYAPQKWETRWVDAYNFDMFVTCAINTIQDFEWVDTVVISGNGQTTNIDYN